MNDNQTDRQHLAQALGRVVDRMVKRHGMDLLDVSAALGVVAGTMTAVNAPSEMDGPVVAIMTLGFSEAAKATRALRG